MGNCVTSYAYDDDTCKLKKNDTKKVNSVYGKNDSKHSAVKDSTKDYSDKIAKMKARIVDHPEYDETKHDDSWILSFYLSHKTSSKAIEAAKKTLESGSHEEDLDQPRDAITKPTEDPKPLLVDTHTPAPVEIDQIMKPLASESAEYRPDSESGKRRSKQGSLKSFKKLFRISIYSRSSLFKSRSYDSSLGRDCVSHSYSRGDDTTQSINAKGTLFFVDSSDMSEAFVQSIKTKNSKALPCLQLDLFDCRHHRSSQL